MADCAVLGEPDLLDKLNEKGEQKMATVVSMINMKGGVGKTTLAIQLAHIADQVNLRTLAIDLDPQSNLSQALMGPRAYIEHLALDKPTVVQIFDEYVPTSSRSGSPRVLNINKAGVFGHYGVTTTSAISTGVPTRERGSQN
jgi:hypothetical protein